MKKRKIIKEPNFDSELRKLFQIEKDYRDFAEATIDWFTWLAHEGQQYFGEEGSYDLWIKRAPVPHLSKIIVFWYFYDDKIVRLFPPTSEPFGPSA